MKVSSVWTRNLWYIFFAFVLVWPALYNMFPLVTPDTGTYIHSGLALTMPIDRPWGYGIFLLLTSWAVSPWFPIFWQGFFCAWLIIKLGRKCFGENMTWNFWAGIMIVVSFGTGAAWFNSQIMADAFTGLSLIAILLLYLKPTTRKERNTLNAFVIFCLFTHTSHIITVLLLGVILFVYFAKKGMKFEKLVSLKLSIYSIIVALIISFANFVGHYGFALSPVSHMFLISRMAENGILDTYLKDQCPVEPNVLCPYQGKTGLRQWEFMWMGDFPHIKQGWLETKEPYSKIVWSTLLKPKYLGMHIVKNTEAGLKQLTQLQVKEGIEQDNPAGSPPYEAIKKEFPSYIKEFESDRQNSHGLPLDTINVIIQLFSVSIIILAFWSRSYNKIEDEKSGRQQIWADVFVITVVFLIINAFITGTFSTVIGRLQSRVFWVLPVVCLFYFLNMVRRKYLVSGSVKDDAKLW